MKKVFAIWFLFVACVQAGDLVFTEKIKDIDAPADATTLTADFSFTNSSKDSVTIVKTDPGCSCLKVEVSGGKLKYAPGESGVVRATFDMGNYSGVVEKKVAVWLDADAPDQPSKTLTVRFHIPVLVATDPKTVQWNIGDPSTPQVIHVGMSEGQMIRVNQVDSSSESFTCEIKTIEDGRRYDILVTPKEMNRSGMAVIRIKTDCEIAKYKVQQAFAVVRKSAPTPSTSRP